MQGDRSVRLVMLSALFFCMYSMPSYSQTRNPAVQIKVDTDKFEIVDGHKYYLSDFNLYTVVNGRRYFITHLAHRMVGIPEPLVDPSGKYVVYAGNTGCGFEGEGMTVFISDVYGKNKAPILGRCWYLRPARFFSVGGKIYLLITAESESPEKEFWLYDLTKREFVLHTDGDIREISNGVFNYGQSDDEGNFKAIGKVTMETLIKRGAPLKLLSRYPTHGLTQKSRVPVYESDSCYSVDEKPFERIPAANTKVLILMECQDGGYEIYLNGYKGKVKKGAIRAIEFGSGK